MKDLLIGILLKACISDNVVSELSFGGFWFLNLSILKLFKLITYNYAY